MNTLRPNPAMRRPLRSGLLPAASPFTALSAASPCADYNPSNLHELETPIVQQDGALNRHDIYYFTASKGASCSSRRWRSETSDWTDSAEHLSSFYEWGKSGHWLRRWMSRDPCVFDDGPPWCAAA